MSYTCMSCQVIFANSELQREHHKSDWHRYNLKRKVVQLPPVSAETFKNRILSQKAQDSPVDDGSKMCNVCHKTFSSANTYNNHMESKKHLETVNKKKENSKKGKELRKTKRNVSLTCDAKVRLESVGSENDEAYEDIADDDSNWSSCDDIADDDSNWSSCDEGEMDAEEAPSIDTTVCLFCDTQSETLEQNVDHMTVKHSFFIPDVEFLVDFDGIIEYLGWKVGVGKLCLWCSSKKSMFPNEKAVKQHMVDKGHCKVSTEGDRVLEFADFYDYSSSYPDAATNNDKDEEIDVPQIDGDDWQLVLPSGTIIGHRSLKVYYKQNVPEKRVCQRTVNRLVSQYRALGWTGTTGEAAVRKARDIQFIEKVKSKRMLKTGMKHNSVKQKHFRNQNPI